MAVRAHQRDVKLAAGLTTVHARWHDFKSALGLTAVLALQRDVEWAAELTVVLACRSLGQQSVGGGADRGDCSACLLAQRRVGAEADGSAPSLGR